MSKRELASFLVLGVKALIRPNGLDMVLQGSLGEISLCSALSYLRKQLSVRPFVRYHFVPLSVS